MFHLTKRWSKESVQDMKIYKDMKQSEKDKQLIEAAFEINYTRWYEIESLIEQAESEETKRILKSRMVSLYHQEEASAGLL